MTTPINLNKARKERNRAEAKKQADQNAANFGRSKAERLLDATRNVQATRRLDQLKFDDDER